MPRKRNSGDDEDKLDNSQYPDAGRYVRQLLGYGTDYQYSNRDASARTGVNYVTISTMANGVQPEIGTIVKFCVGMPGGNINKLLRLFKYNPIGSTPDELKRLGLVPQGYDLTPRASGKSEENEGDFMMWRLDEMVRKMVKKTFDGKKPTEDELQKEYHRIYTDFIALLDKPEGLLEKKTD